MEDTIQKWCFLYVSQTFNELFLRTESILMDKTDGDLHAKVSQTVRRLEIKKQHSSYISENFKGCSHFAFL